MLLPRLYSGRLCVVVLLPEVSSTLVRSAIARGAWEEAAKLVPRPVLAHVREKGLYGAPA